MAAGMLGACENLFWDNVGARMVNYRTCGAPAMVVGDTVRNQCPGCAVNTAAYGERLLAGWADALDGPEAAADWLDRQEELLDDEYERLAQQGAKRAAMAEVLKIRGHIRRREHMIAGVTARWPQVLELAA